MLEMGLDLPKLERADTIGLIMAYINRVNPDYSWERLKKIEQQTLKKEDRIMEGYVDKVRKEASQQAWQTGRQEGRKERNQEVIFNMLKEKADIAFISKVTGLPAKEIKKLKNGS